MVCHLVSRCGLLWWFGCFWCGVGLAVCLLGGSHGEGNALELLT